MADKIIPAPNVPPFVTFVTSAVPMVFDNSLSYYEALCALWKWLQDDVVDVINNNAEVTQNYIDLTNEYTQKFIELKEYVDTYFDNLDVQEEINNKLDAMVEDGTLQTLINNFLQPNVSWTFDTVADMQASTNLVDGGYAQTLGFHSLNDGGAGLYKITSTGTANGMNVLTAGSLYATLVVGNEANAKQFGAYGDDTHDDHDVLQYILSNYSNVYIPNATYLIGTTLEITRSNQKITCDGGLDYNGTGFAIQFVSGIDNNIYIRHIVSVSGGGILVQPTASCGRNRLEVNTMEVDDETFKVTGTYSSSSWYLYGLRWNSVSSYAVNFNIPSGASGVYFNRFIFNNMALLAHPSDTKGILLTDNGDNTCDIQVQFKTVNFENVKGIRTSGIVGYLTIDNCRITEIVSTDWFEVNGYIPNTVITGAGRVFLKNMHFNNITGGEEVVLNIRAQDTGLYDYSGYTYNGGTIKRTNDNYVVFVPDDNNNTHYAYMASADTCTVGDEEARDLTIPFMTPYCIIVNNAGATTEVNVPLWVYTNRTSLILRLGSSTTTLKYGTTTVGTYSAVNKNYLISNSSNYAKAIQFL